MSYYQLFVQFLAIIALIVWASSYHFKQRKNILLIQMSSFIFYIAHFFLLGAYAGAAFAILAVLRLAVFSFKTKNNWVSCPLVLCGFIVLSIIAFALTFSAYWVILSLFGSVIAIIASWQYNQRTIRILFIPSHICWIAYDIFVGSYGGAVTETIVGFSALASLFRKKLN